MKPRIDLSRGQWPELGVGRAAELLDKGQAMVVDLREPEGMRAWRRTGRPLEPSDGRVA